MTQKKVMHRLCMTGDVLSITLWRKQQRQRAKMSERKTHSEFNERFHTTMSF